MSTHTSARAALGPPLVAPLTMAMATMLRWRMVRLVLLWRRCGPVLAQMMPMLVVPVVLMLLMLPVEQDLRVHVVLLL